MKKLILVLAIAFIAAVVVRLIMQKSGRADVEFEAGEVQVIET